jgi:hypothetical protein
LTQFVYGLGESESRGQLWVGWPLDVLHHGGAEEAMRMTVGWWKLNEDHSVEYVGEGIEAIKQIQYDDAERRRVGLDQIGPFRVSTVFLALDHNYSDRGDPILFETMVFPQDSHTDLACVRYCTWAQARAGHAFMVEALQAWMKKHPNSGSKAGFRYLSAFLDKYRTRSGKPRALKSGSKETPTSSASEGTTDE